MQDFPSSDPDKQIQPSTAATSKTRPRDQLPRYKVLVHKSDLVEMELFFDAVRDLAALSDAAAAVVVMQAHNEGSGLLLVTHKERAELYIEQFDELGLIATAHLLD